MSERLLLTNSNKDATIKKSMTSYEFTLLFRGADLLSDESLDALFEAGCDDATFGEREKLQYAMFQREADNLATAIKSAIDAIEMTVPGAKVVRVEPDEFVSLTVIAERVSMTNEGVRSYTVGRVGPGGFPSPVSWIDQKNRVWRWSDVVEWFANDLGKPIASQQEAETIAAFNGVLEARLHLERIGHGEERSTIASFVRSELNELLPA